MDEYSEPLVVRGEPRLESRPPRPASLRPIGAAGAWEQAASASPAAGRGLGEVLVQASTRPELHLSVRPPAGRIPAPDSAGWGDSSADQLPNNGRGSAPPRSRGRATGQQRRANRKASEDDGLEDKPRRRADHPYNITPDQARHRAAARGVFAGKVVAAAHQDGTAAVAGQASGGTFDENSGSTEYYFRHPNNDAGGLDESLLDDDDSTATTSFSPPSSVQSTAGAALIVDPEVSAAIAFEYSAALLAPETESGAEREGVGGKKVGRVTSEGVVPPGEAAAEAARTLPHPNPLHPPPATRASLLPEHATEAPFLRDSE